MKFDNRYWLWGLCVLLLGLLPAFAGFVGVSWDLSQLCGLIGFIACVILAGAPIRPRQGVPRTLLSLANHSLLGWIALGTVTVHIGGLLLSDHWVLEYLKVSTPLYQLSGIAAALLLLTLTFTAIAGARRRLWASHRGFQASHVTLSCGLLVLAAVHVIATGRYAGSPLRRCLVIAAAVGGVCMLLRARAGTSDAREAAGLNRRWVFGRHATWVLSVIAATTSVSLALAVTGAANQFREPVVRRVKALPLDFPHTKHVEVPCATCHHNFVDDRGMDTCIQCHRNDRADLKVGIEARFHGFCLECHRHPNASLTKHGPVAGCNQCHRFPTQI